MDKNHLIEKMFLVSKFSDLNGYDRGVLKDLYRNGKFNEDQENRFWKLLYEDEKLLPKKPNFTDEEIGYRRGYTHGVYYALLGKVTNEDVKEWIRSFRLTGAPGTCFEKLTLLGLVKEEVQPAFEKFNPK